ncbi:efflux transporter outer membrane subunit [Bordetella hinzii]|uniref:RND transporter n=1 Tax=Bordetella hinzii TaxID=103855 RepID=A0AAN1RYU5_9BORD|nr:efflux transporter outer membrane subunit [Bordetella hinzii]AKQ60403.1 Outer membrane protein OprM precursor [Bordetella hinzii]AZW18544.1 RND transporter [Bordetella hinzii]MBZ0076995.1 efflux transporter outer membrane subunit [Bordetella hinzii]MBZ0081614.1 efflux transporter outer membrane subunit [Bordetella hinzii]MBZ0085920.1 efflux transporter outer membrane subunit [Bordetella hinzii]
MARRLLSLAISASLLSGCMSLAPEHTRPPLPVAAAFPQPAAPVSAAMPAAAVDWQSFYTDPELRGLIARALINNRDLRMAVLRVEEARAAYGIQRADQFPTLGLAADAVRQRTPGDLSITGQPLTASQYQVGVGMASWELDFWGRVRNLKDAALENYLATDAARQAATLSLIAQVADSYLTLRELDERLALTRATIASREESLRIFRRRFEVGAISKLDLTQVETLWQQAKALGAELERTRAAQAQALQELVGQPIDLPEARAALDDDALMRELPAGLPSDLLTNRPDIVAAEHQLRASNANIGAARAASLPQITLTGAFGTASSQLDGLFDSGSLAWNFAPSINLPIFDAGRRQANLELAQARQQQAVAQYEKSIQTAFREVADALSARYWLAEQVKVLRATVDAQAERERLARLRYDHGASPFLEVLDAQRDLLEAQQQWVRTRRALLSSQVALYAALGGGTQAQPAGPATPEHP